MRHEESKIIVIASHTGLLGLLQPLAVGAIAHEECNFIVITSHTDVYGSL